MKNLKYVIALDTNGANPGFWSCRNSHYVDSPHAASWFNFPQNAEDEIQNIPRKYTAQVFELVPYEKPMPAALEGDPSS